MMCVVNVSVGGIKAFLLTLPNTLLQENNRQTVKFIMTTFKKTKKTEAKICTCYHKITCFKVHHLRRKMKRTVDKPFSNPN